MYNEKFAGVYTRISKDTIDWRYEYEDCGRIK